MNTTFLRLQYAGKTQIRNISIDIYSGEAVGWTNMLREPNPTDGTGTKTANSILA
jgi:hypothetical protein